MDTKTPSEIASYIRPLLVELADAVSLPKGVLGLALLGIEIEGSHPVFAEFVEQGRDLNEVRQSLDAEKLDHTVQYSFSRYHPLMSCLKSDSDECCVLLRADAATSQNDGTGQDVWEPLIKLFGSEESVPAQIRVWRKWFTEQKRIALYYLPANQQSTNDSWLALSRVIPLAAHSLRWTIICMHVSEHISTEDADLLLACLPKFLSDSEERLFTLLTQARAYQRQPLNLTIDVRYDQYNDKLIVEGNRPGLKSSVLVELHPPEKANMQHIDHAWVVGGANSQRQKMIVAILAVRKAWASNKKGLERSASIPWFGFWPLIWPNESFDYSLLSNPTGHCKAPSFLDEKLPPEYFSRKETTGRVDLTARRTKRSNELAKIRQQINRANGFLSRSFELLEEEVELISAHTPRFSHEKEFEITPDVSTDESFVTKAKRDPRHWVYHFMKQVFEHTPQDQK